MREIPTVCPRDCYDTCSVIARVDDEGLVSSVRGNPSSPVTRGFTCPRGKKDALRTYENRVLFPHLRTGAKPGRKFRRTSWDEALNIISRRLATTIRERGGDAVLLLDYAGYTGLLSTSFSHRLWYSIGATRTDYALCSKSGHTGISLHYGKSYGILPDDIPDRDLIVFWGFNAPESSPHFWALAHEAGKRGARIIVIDPRRCEAARRADLWIDPRPGSDVALAMGVSNYLIGNGATDRQFIENHTTGFDIFRKEAASWTPERVTECTALEWSKVEELGRAFGEAQKPAVLIGIGLQKNDGGADMARAASLLPALRGNHRGFFYSAKQGFLVDEDVLSGKTLVETSPAKVSQVDLGRRIREGEFAFVFLYGMNPALTLPNQSAFREGISREDTFVVVHDSHWSESADHADVVLPATGFLEKSDIVLPWLHNSVRLSRKVIEPVGESRNEVWLMTELARRLGRSDHWLFEDPWAALAEAFEGSLDGGSFDDLISGKTLLLAYRPRDEYQTPSGMIEFAPEAARESGCDPLPRQRRQSIESDEFVLLGSASRRYTNTQFREIYGPIPPEVSINTEDALRLGIREGDAVTLTNELGSIRMRALVTADVQTGVLWAPRQSIDLDGKPLNTITSGTPQKLGGGPRFNSTRVKLRL